MQNNSLLIQNFPVRLQNFLLAMPGNDFFEAKVAYFFRENKVIQNLLKLDTLICETMVKMFRYLTPCFLSW